MYISQLLFRKNSLYLFPRSQTRSPLLASWCKRGRRSSPLLSTGGSCLHVVFSRHPLPPSFYFYFIFSPTSYFPPSLNVRGQLGLGLCRHSLPFFGLFLKETVTWHALFLDSPDWFRAKWDDICLPMSFLSRARFPSEEPRAFRDCCSRSSGLCFSFASQFVLGWDVII